MQKSEFVAKVAESAGISKRQAEAAIDAVGDTINISVRSGVDIVLPGVGKFVRKDRGARVGRNPRTGETVQIAAKRVPGFKPAKELRDAVA